MLVRSIITAFALAGLATAIPTEEFEDELEARGTCSPGHSYCCKSAIKPLNLWFIKAAGQDCVPGSYPCGPKKTYLCCDGGQIKVSIRVTIKLLPKKRLLTDIRTVKASSAPRNGKIAQPRYPAVCWILSSCGESCWSHFDWASCSWVCFEHVTLI